MEINEKAIIVTGGASGLGEGTARLLSSLGAKIAIFDLNAEKGKMVADDIGGIFVETDITDEQSVEQAMAKARDAHGPVRILVNCAAIGGPSIRTAGKSGPYPLNIFKKLIEINLVGAFNVCRLAAAEMASLDPLDRGERGVLINVASINALDGPVGGVAYTAAKAGVVGMTITIARDMAPRGVRCCTIAPGNFETPMLMAAPKEFLDVLLSAVPFPRDKFGQPEDFAKMVVSICENIMLNGEVIRLDGAIRHSQSK